VAGERARLRKLAINLLDEAFQHLTEEKVLPRSRYEPWIHVGSEFEGWLIQGLPSHAEFETTLESAFPARFSGKDAARDFASLYPSALVTSAVAWLTLTGQPYEGSQPAADGAIRAFLRYVSSPAEPVVVVFAVAGVATSDGGPLKARQLTVVPCNDIGNPQTIAMVERIVPGAGHALKDATLFRVGLPTCLLVASGRERFVESDHFGDAYSRRLSSLAEQIGGFVSALRLVTSGTVHVLGYIQGQPGPFQLFRPRVSEAPFRDSLADVRRVVTLESRLVPLLYRLDRLWRDTTASAKGVVPSLAIAGQRFNRAFSEDHWQARLTDLAVALEAAMGQQDDPAELSLRLRNRAASLLADEADDAGRIFDDLKVMYDLRSTLLHGSSQDTKELMKRIERVPAAKRRALAGTKVEFFIDRCRDLVRRAILVRLMLAQGASPDWPVAGSQNLDKNLTDERHRKRLKNLWRARLRGLGLSSAAGPAATATSWHESTP
jgi:Apea-like HEPN